MDNQVATTIAGKGGEAVAKRLKDSTLENKALIEKPNDAGWYVAVVRCNCEKKIAAAI